MTAQSRYRQLKLGIDFLNDHYESVCLSFRMGPHLVTGTLKGSAADWIFYSDCPAFLEQVPGGVLQKYALWIDRIPPRISTVYNGILDAAWKAGYDMNERDEEPT